MDLAEIPTDVLTAELGRRFDVWFWVGSRQPLSASGIGEEECVEAKAHGKPLELLGLIERQKFVILNDMVGESRPGTDDD